MTAGEDIVGPGLLRRVGGLNHNRGAAASFINLTKEIRDESG